VGRFKAVLGAVGGASLALAGCTSGSSPTQHPAAALARTMQAAVPFRLYTHCGIDEARIGSQYYEAVPPLIQDGSSPTGWGNPYQQGAMTLRPPSEAIFTDNLGHRVVFRLRPHATRFKHICS